MTTPPTNRWEDAEDLLVSLGRDDIEECCGEVHPTLVAFAGRRLRFLADVRPFAKGEYHDPLIELFALSMPLGADRLALSVSGRITSLRDPIPPVLDDGTDLRQRALILHVVDGADATDERPHVHTVFHPYDLVGGDGCRPESVTWLDRTRLDEEPLGWIPEAMRTAAVASRTFRAPEREIRDQAERCVALGHDLHLPPDMAERLAPPATARGRPHHRRPAPSRRR